MGPLSAAVTDGPMKGPRGLGLALSWPWATSAFLFDVALLALVGHLPDGGLGTGAWWAGVTVAAAVTTAAVLTYHGITIATASARWVWPWLSYIGESSPGPYATSSPGCTPAINHRRRFGRGVVGVREHRGRLVGMIAVEEVTDFPSDGHQHQTGSTVTLPVAAVAAALHQFDVSLDTIDIVSARKKPATHPSAPETVHPADDADIEQGTWLVLRMDPQLNVAAVAARDSIASTLAAAVERLSRDLDGWRCTVRPVTGDEFPQVDAAVAAGLRPFSTRRGWRHLKYFDKYATSFWVSPRQITSEALETLWLPDTDATVVTIRLTTAPAGPPEVSAWVRYHSTEPLSKDFWADTVLNRLISHQLAAVLASMPAPTRHPPLVVPARALREHERLAVRVDHVAARAAPRPAVHTELGDGASRRAATGARKVKSVRISGLLEHGIRNRRGDHRASRQKDRSLGSLAK